MKPVRLVMLETEPMGKFCEGCATPDDPHGACWCQTWGISDGVAHPGRWRLLWGVRGLPARLRRRRRRRGVEPAR